MTRPHTRFLYVLFFCAVAISCFAQVGEMPKAEVPMHDVSLIESDNMSLPYAEIPAAPEDYSPGSLLSRMIDGLGFRYHWVSEDLREEDLSYRPTAEASSSFETLEHIHSLSNTVLNTAKHAPNIRGEKESLTYEELRSNTLMNLKEASELVKGMTAEQVGELRIIYERDGKQSSFPIWNLLNGQLADAIYHTGQVVSFRRTSGNPIRKGVNVFRGTVKK